MSPRRLILPLVLAALCAFHGEASAQDAAAADALFEDGKRLAAEERWADACPKFEASQAADPSVGTLLNWSDCLEKEGRLGSALARFREAEETLAAAGDARASLAAERRAALEARAPRLLLRSSTPPPAGIAVWLDGAAVPLAGVAVAGVERLVDPGTRVIEVRRGDRVLERREGDAKEGVVSELVLDLERIDRDNPEVALTAPAPAPREEPSKVPLVVGWILVGTGGVAVLTGGVLGLVALGEDAESEEPGRCLDGVCSPAGIANVSAAGDLAEAGQWVGIAGVGLLAVGITLVLTAPSSDESAKAPPPLRLVASPLRVGLEGGF